MLEKIIVTASVGQSTEISARFEKVKEMEKKNSSTLCHAIFCSTCDIIFYNDYLQSALWWPSVLFIFFITNSFFFLVTLIFQCSLLKYAVYHFIFLFFFSNFMIVLCYICLVWIRKFDFNFSPKLSFVSLEFHLIFIC